MILMIFPATSDMTVMWSIQFKGLKVKFIWFQVPR